MTYHDPRWLARQVSIYVPYFTESGSILVARFINRHEAKTAVRLGQVVRNGELVRFNPIDGLFTANELRDWTPNP